MMDRAGHHGRLPVIVAHRPLHSAVPASAFPAGSPGSSHTRMRASARTDLLATFASIPVASVNWLRNKHILVHFQILYS